jgi:hypothetical protein
MSKERDEPKVKEEVIFLGFDRGWDREMPVTLIDYGTSMNIHRQSGSHFIPHMKEAAKILAKRGLVIQDEICEWTYGPTGLYRSVVRMLTDESIAEAESRGFDKAIQALEDDVFGFSQVSSIQWSAFLRERKEAALKKELPRCDELDSVSTEKRP